MMKLSQLEPQLIRIKEAGKVYQDVDHLEQAQGIRFLCPACFQTNGGAVGTHAVICWFKGRGVSSAETPGPGRWAVSGKGLEDISLSPSIRIDCWHGFVKDGAIR